MWFRRAYNLCDFCLKTLRRGCCKISDEDAAQPIVFHEDLVVQTTKGMQNKIWGECNRVPFGNKAPNKNLLLRFQSSFSTFVLSIKDKDDSERGFLGVVEGWGKNQHFSLPFSLHFPSIFFLLLYILIKTKVFEEPSKRWVWGLPLFSLGTYIHSGGSLLGLSHKCSVFHRMLFLDWIIGSLQP